MKAPNIPPLYLAAAVAAAVAIYALNKGVSAITDAASDALHAVDPTNHDNVFATAVNNVGGAVMGAGGATVAGMNADGSWSLGGYVYDMTHRDAVTGKYAWWQF